MTNLPFASRTILEAMEESCYRHLTISTDDDEYDGIGRRRHMQFPSPLTQFSIYSLTWFPWRRRVMVWIRCHFLLGWSRWTNRFLQLSYLPILPPMPNDRETIQGYLFAGGEEELLVNRKTRMFTLQKVESTTMTENGTRPEHSC